MSNKLLIIGIDSLDIKLLSKFEKNLPNLQKLRQKGVTLACDSVFPPDSDTAWASIYTGWNPARHGVIFFKDPLEKAGTKLNQDTDNSNIRGNAFWDIASKNGKSVCLVFPHLGYPVWEVNGIMLGRTSKQDKKKYSIMSYPASLTKEYPSLERLNVVTGLPSSRSFDKFINSWKTLIENETTLGLELWQKNKWDLFLLFSSGADWIQHYTWLYFDETDPSYPGENKYSGAIEECYKWYDRMVGKFLNEIDSNTTLIVMSDHGHGRRPVRLVNINEILRRRGLLTPRIKKSSPTDPYYLLEIMRRKTVEFINRYSHSGIGPLAGKLLKIIPLWRQMYITPPTIDWTNTKAYVSDLSGVKAYDYGGIIINKSSIKDVEYEQLRLELIGELLTLKEPTSGQNLMKWVKRREDLYSGEYIHKYPDIVFELSEDYGAGWAIHDELISPCHTHNIVPGSHKIHSSVFIMSNYDKNKIIKHRISVMDIAPTVLEILGVDSTDQLDGKSIFTA